MAEFRVTWEIDIDAETPRAAALMAQRIQRDRNSAATFFTVSKWSGRMFSKTQRIVTFTQPIEIDLSKPEEKS